MRKVLMLGSVLLLLVALGFAVKIKIAPLSWELWGDTNVESGVGIHGYDVVSYHVSATAMVGLEEHSSSYNGANWHFITLENKNKFDANPEYYVPRYGGFCAYAVYNNVTADVNPAIWHIESEKLYLFASEGVKDDWILEIPAGAIETTNQQWAQR